MPHTGAGKCGGGGNSNRSRRVSSRLAGSGQVNPADSARRRYSLTVGRAIPQLLAIRRLLSLLDHLRRRTSLILRMDNLFAGICSPPCEKGQTTGLLSRVGRSSRYPQATCQGGSFAVESVAAFAWNGWQASSGISGSFGLEYASRWKARVFWGGGYFPSFSDSRRRGGAYG